MGHSDQKSNTSAQYTSTNKGPLEIICYVGTGATVCTPVIRYNVYPLFADTIWVHSQMRKTSYREQLILSEQCFRSINSEQKVLSTAIHILMIWTNAPEIHSENQSSAAVNMLRKKGTKAVTVSFNRYIFVPYLPLNGEY